MTPEPKRGRAAESARTPVILFAPGAGAASSSPWMSAWRDRLATIGATETLDYPYRLAGRKAPDRLPILIAAHREALRIVRAAHSGKPVVLVGKSMGGRVGCHVAVDECEANPIDALVCLGYPLRGTSGAVRDEVLLALRTPVLFVQGTRDPLCPLDLLSGVRDRMTAPNELLIVEGGNHSLDVPRRRAARDDGRGPGAAEEVPPASQEKPSQETMNSTILAFIGDFVARVIARKHDNTT